MKISTKVSGLKQVQNRMRQLEGKMQRKIARSAVAKSATPILKRARQLAPKDSGTLEKALTKRAKSRASEGLFFSLIGVRVDRYRSERTAGKYKPDHVARYFRFTELGTKYHAAKPYLVPAMEEHQSKAPRQIGEEIMKGIDKAL